MILHPATRRQLRKEWAEFKPWLPDIAAGLVLILVIWGLLVLT
jgi:hypothetical protein